MNIDFFDFILLTIHLRLKATYIFMIIFKKPNYKKTLIYAIFKLITKSKLYIEILSILHHVYVSCNIALSIFQGC